MNLSFRNQQKDLLFSRPKSLLLSIVQHVLKKENASCNELSIFFITDAKMRKMHKDFFNDPTSTDCISHPIDAPNSPGYTYLGDIFVCPHVALAFSAKKNKDPYKEVTLYVVHGLLHLLGYDDIDPDDRKVMKTKERRYMKQLEMTGQILQ